MNYATIYKKALAVTTCISIALAASAQSPPTSADALIHKLVQKGILNEQEAKELIDESVQTNLVSASKWKINNAIKNIELFGDARFRYEYRDAANAPGSGSTKEDYFRERFRFALRAGIRG